MTEFIQVVTTVDSEERAREIAAVLLERHLAGCVQTSGPISSTYRWQGRIETDEEWYCTVKTAAALFEKVEAAITELHPYDEPEILAFQVATGSSGYLNWLGEQLSL